MDTKTILPMDTKSILDSSRSTNPKSKQITILGAGIAGLLAAYELEKLGHQVEIMEGSQRIGGRIWTHRFGEGADAPYVELGAMRISKEHKHTLRYIYEMGLEDKLCKFTTIFEEENALMNFQGEVFRMKDTLRIFEQRHQDIFLSRKYSRKTRLFAAWLKTIIDAIAPAKLRSNFELNLKSHLMDELEKLDLEPFFSKDGNTINLQKFIKATPCFRDGCSKALSMFLDDVLIETSHDLLQLEGGMDQLIQRLAETIRAPIKCNREVVAFDVQENSVKVSWLENGKLRTRNCDYVLCTIPFSILKKMELGGFDKQKLKSIHDTVYCPATKVLFHCTEAFWVKEGIRGGASFSGKGIRQTYYPSVKFNPSQGSTLLASYTIGDDAKSLDNMLDEQRHNYVKDVVSQIHPEINTSGMVIDAVTMSWGNYKWGGGGCSIPWGGDISDELDHDLNYLEAARPQNRLFFAGEHCSRFPAWIEGSIESALKAIYDISDYQPGEEIDKMPLMPVEPEKIVGFPVLVFP